MNFSRLFGWFILMKSVSCSVSHQLKKCISFGDRPARIMTRVRPVCENQKTVFFTGNEPQAFLEICSHIFHLLLRQL